MATCSWDSTSLGPRGCELADVAMALATHELLRAGRVAANGRRIVIEFPESDFALGFRDDHRHQRCQVRITAAVRAPHPSYDTWWTEWSVSAWCDAAVDVAVQEVAQARARFQRIVKERVRTA